MIVMLGPCQCRLALTYHSVIATCHICDTGKKGDVSKPGYPSLHPSGDPPDPRWCQVPGPMILSTSDGNDGAHLAQRGSLSNGAAEDDQDAPRKCFRAAVE